MNLSGANWQNPPRLKCPWPIGLAIVLLHGCATLPDTKESAQEQQLVPVTFESGHGRTSPAKSQAILQQLKVRTGATALLDQHLPYEQAINVASPLVTGNKLTLLQNGPATYKSMFADIRNAKNHINLETYIFDEGDIGNQFAELLLERQRAGVQVNLIYDSIGTLLTPPEFFDRLQQNGVQLLEFNPVNPLEGNKSDWLPNNRDHRRQLIIDGRIAYTGGLNISDTYSSAPSQKRKKKHPDTPDQDASGWRDTHIRIEGPVVAEFQKLFMDTWKRQKGDPLAARDYFPALRPRGDEIVRAIGSTPDAPESLIYLTLMSAITHAGQSVHLTIAYFAPDPQLSDALVSAAQRGVDVTLVLPSHSDSWAIFHLGRSHYTTLLRGGVKIFERRGAIMHAKTACIDGVWSTIGSTNLDWRSFLHNDEINAVILGQDFATQMETMFAHDLDESSEVTLQEWRRRSLLMRLKEIFARVGAYWL